MKRFAKACERRGRRLLLQVLRFVFGVAPVPVELPHNRPARVVVLRLDARIGNVILTTPLLRRLRQAYPDARIDCVVHPHSVALLADGADQIGAIPYCKWQVFGPHGFIATALLLQKRRYDVCIDASNPTGPSLTQALLTRASGARCTIGYDVQGFGALYHQRIDTRIQLQQNWHESRRRLALLAPLPKITLGAEVPLPSVGALAEGAGEDIRSFVAHLHATPFAVINISARVQDRRLTAADAAVVANTCTAAGIRPVVVAGRGEAALVASVLQLSLDALAAPDADLAGLAYLFTHARATISGDTGPMHLAVACGCPTLAIFLASAPARYGYQQAGHACLDARDQSLEQWQPQLRNFVLQAATSSSPAASGRRPADAQQAPHAGRSAPHVGTAQVPPA